MQPVSNVLIKKEQRKLRDLFASFGRKGKIPEGRPHGLQFEDGCVEGCWSGVRMLVKGNITVVSGSKNFQLGVKLRRVLLHV